MTPQLIVAIVVTWVLGAFVVAVALGRGIHAADRRHAERRRDGREESTRKPTDRA